MKLFISKYYLHPEGYETPVTQEQRNNIKVIVESRKIQEQHFYILCDTECSRKSE